MRDLVDFNIKYGRFTILEEVESKRLPSGQVNRFFKCECSCGNIKDVRWVHLKRNKISSCGCIVKTRNGLGNSLICKVWRQMISRTTNKDKTTNYYKKNIQTCDEWINSFDSFYEWSNINGYKKGLQIDRIDNSLGYFPENCRWVTPKVNCNNRDVTFFVNYNGKKESLKMVLYRLNKNNDYYTILARIKRGMEHNEAIDKPIRKGNYSKTNFKRIN